MKKKTFNNKTMKVKYWAQWCMNACCMNALFEYEVSVRCAMCMCIWMLNMRSRSLAPWQHTRAIHYHNLNFTVTRIVCECVCVLYKSVALLCCCCCCCFWLIFTCATCIHTMHIMWTRDDGDVESWWWCKKKHDAVHVAHTHTPTPYKSCCPSLIGTMNVLKNWRTHKMKR